MRIAIVGWEEGLAGQVSTWVEDALGASIEYFVHPEAKLPIIIPEKALDRPAKKYSFPKDGFYLDKPILVSEDWVSQLLKSDVQGVVCCLSSPEGRARIYHQLLGTQLQLLTAIHPSAQVLSDTEIQPGCILEPNSYLGYRAELGTCTHLHAGAQVDHHSVIGSFVTINPGAIIAGNTSIGDYSQVNLGANISNRIEIPARTVVGAGATVLKSFFEEGLKLYGTPATPR